MVKTRFSHDFSRFSITKTRPSIVTNSEHLRERLCSRSGVLSESRDCFSSRACFRHRPMKDLSRNESSLLRVKRRKWMWSDTTITWRDVGVSKFFCGKRTVWKRRASTTVGPKRNRVFDGAASLVFYTDGGGQQAFLKSPERVATLQSLADKGVGLG